MYEVGELVELIIPEWLAEKHGFDTCFIEGEVLAVTDKAVLLETLDGDEVWFPLSEVE